MILYNIKGENANSEFKYSKYIPAGGRKFFRVFSIFVFYNNWGARRKRNPIK